MPLADVDYVSPIDVLATATAFLNGKIDLDPASSEAANTIVQADRFFTPAVNGLKQEWRASSVYLYPPKNFLLNIEQPLDRTLFAKPRRFAKSAQRVWLEDLLYRYMKQEFEEAIIFLTSTEVALITVQKLKIDLPICIMAKKPKLFVDDNKLTKLKSPKCYGFIFYVPAALNTDKRVHEFSDMFSTLGRVYC